MLNLPWPICILNAIQRAPSSIEHSAELLKGHICTGVPSKVTRIKLEDSQIKMTDDFCMLVPNTGRKASQWVILDGSTANRLGSEVRGKVHIVITAALDAQGK